MTKAIRPCTRFCGEGWATAGTLAGTSATVIGFVLKSYIITPLGALATLGCGCWCRTARRLRVMEDLQQIDRDLKGVSQDMQATAARAETAVDQARRQNLELAQQTRLVAQDRAAMAAAESALDQELARRGVDVSKLRETVVDLYKANDALTSEKNQISSLLSQLLARIQKFQAENEARRKGVSDLGVVAVEIRAEQEKMLSDVKQQGSQLETQTREIDQAVTALHTSGEQLAVLLSAHIQKLTAEREALTRQVDRVAVVDADVHQRMGQIQTLEQNAAESQRQLQEGLGRIEQIQLERSQVQASLAKLGRQDARRARQASVEQVEWQRIATDLQAAGASLGQTTRAAEAALTDHKEGAEGDAV